MSRRRVVITGMGMVTCLGRDMASTWEGIKAGRSGISAIDHFDAAQYKTRFAGLVRDFDAEQAMPAKELRRYDEFMHYGMSAGVQAIHDSGLEVTTANAGRIGVALGAGIGGISTIERNHDILIKDGPNKISPFLCRAPSSTWRRACWPSVSG